MFTPTKTSARRRAPLATPARERRVASLTELLEKGKRDGFLSAAEIEKTLFATTPDAAEFSLFLDLTRTLGIAIREPEAAPQARQEPRLDALSLYFRDLARHGLLTPEEERRVARRARDGDAQARERMILCNLRLVISIARRYTGRGVPLEDLIEEGNLGLITAVERFDPEKGFRFSTYAAWWIRQAIANGVAEQSRTLRIPLHVMRALHQYIEAERRLSLDLERRPDSAEVCRAAGFGPRRGRRVLALLQGIRSLDEEAAGNASSQLTLIERTPDKLSLEQTIFRQLENAHLEALMQRLSEKEVLVLRIRYGFIDGQACSLTRVGGELGVSRERVRQIEKRALRRLREWLEAEEQGAERLAEKSGKRPWN